MRRLCVKIAQSWVQELRGGERTDSNCRQAEYRQKNEAAEIKNPLLLDGYLPTDVKRAGNFDFTRILPAPPVFSLGAVAVLAGGLGRSIASICAPGLRGVTTGPGVSR